MAKISEADSLDRRTFDLLRLIDAKEPIGSIRLVELLQQRGYSIQDRTVRLALSELDDAGLTTKVPGKGRRLTEAGRRELAHGDVSGRLAQVRERIATLRSQVSYDPLEDAGQLVVSQGVVPEDRLSAALADLNEMGEAGMGPVLAATEPAENGVCISLPSSITLDGTFLARGIGAELITAGLVEYTPVDDEVLRYVDAISGEGSTMDVVHLLIEAGRTDVASALDGEMGVLIVDNRQFPLPRYTEAEDLSSAIVETLGGVLDIRRPRESGPFPGEPPGWNVGSLTYGGVGELALSLLFERDRLTEWETLTGLASRADLMPVASLAAGSHRL
ncbi:MAG: NrpR regulatory domain-containing protein [Halolamina sp.]